jgi:hypothetical protein
MAVPAIIHAEHRVVRALRQAGAVGPEAARPLLDMSGLEQRATNRMLATGAIREAAAGRYWLDEAAYGSYRGERRRRALLVMAAALLVVLGLALLGIVRL